MVIQFLFESIFSLPLRVFRRRRYQNFTLKCCDSQIPPIRYIEGSWVSKKITLDQIRMNAYLSSQPLMGTNLLHVGIGSSAIAKSFANKVDHIDGVTVTQAEYDHALTLHCNNYRIFQFNKYGNQMLELPRHYNFILDNNLSSYACCIYHFKTMLEQYLQLLKPNGQLVTDTKGLRYYMTGFGLTVNELKEWESTLPMQVTQVNKHLLIITRRG